MKNYYFKTLAFLFLAAVLLGFSGCAGTESTDTVHTAKGGGESESSEPQSKDYLGYADALAAFYAEDGGFSETRYYPAEIITAGSEETKGEYQVVSLVGDFDVAEGDENWTDDLVLESHPAEKDELEESMIVLFTKKEVKEGLKEARWQKGIIASTDELYKGVVTVDFVWHLDRSDEGDRQYELKLEQIRVIDELTLE